MAIRRLGQVAAEMQCREEFIVFPLGDPDISNTRAYSGTYSLKRGVYDSFGIGFDAVSAVRAGVHFYAESGGSDDARILYCKNPDNSNSIPFGIAAEYDTHTLKFYSEGALLDSVVNPKLNTDEWHHFGFLWSSSGIFRAWMDGESILNYDKGSSFSDGTVNAIFSGQSPAIGAVTYSDNLYADEVTGSDINSVPPKKMFLFKNVTGPGTYDDWTHVNESANWKAIDDPNAHNGDTDYNEATSGSLIDTFGTSPVSIPQDTSEYIYVVRAVVPQLIVKKNNSAQDAGVRMVAYDGASLEYGNDKNYIGPGYELAWDRFEEQPDGTSWTEDDINAMEFGYQSRGSF